MKFAACIDTVLLAALLVPGSAAAAVAENHHLRGQQQRLLQPDEDFFQTSFLIFPTEETEGGLQTDLFTVPQGKMAIVESISVQLATTQRATWYNAQLLGCCRECVGSETNQGAAVVPIPLRHINLLNRGSQLTGTRDGVTMFTTFCQAESTDGEDFPGLQLVVQVGGRRAGAQIGGLGTVSGRLVPLPEGPIDV